MERDYRAAARVFKALCDPKRLAILEADPVRAILPHEGAVRVRLGGEPAGGQVDPLPAEQDRQEVRGEAAAGADYAGYRTGDTA